jgi:hypothetical protein
LTLVRERAKKKPGLGRVFHECLIAQAAGFIEAFFLLCFFAMAFLAGISFFISSFFISSFLAIGEAGAAAAGAEAWAKAPIEKAEAIRTAMSFFMVFFLQGIDERAVARESQRAQRNAG